MIDNLSYDNYEVAILYEKTKIAQLLFLYSGETVKTFVNEFVNIGKMGLEWILILAIEELKKYWRNQFAFLKVEFKIYLP